MPVPGLPETAEKNANEKKRQHQCCRFFMPRSAGRRFPLRYLGFAVAADGTAATLHLPFFRSFMKSPEPNTKQAQMISLPRLPYRRRQSRRRIWNRRQLHPDPDRPDWPGYGLQFGRPHLSVQCLSLPPAQLPGRSSRLFQYCPQIHYPWRSVQAVFSHFRSKTPGPTVPGFAGSVICPVHRFIGVHIIPHADEGTLATGIGGLAALAGGGTRR